MIIEFSATLSCSQSPSSQPLRKPPLSFGSLLTECLSNMADSDEEIIQDGNASPVLISLSQILEMVKNTIKEEKQWGRKPEAGTRKVAPISANAYLSTLYNIIQGGLSRGINCVAIDRVVQAGTYTATLGPPEQY